MEGGAEGRSWRVRKEAGALRAEGVRVGVWGEVGWGVREVGAVRVEVGEVENQWAGREEGGGCSIGVPRTGRSFASRAQRVMACGGVVSAGMSPSSVALPGRTWLGSIFPPIFALTAARTAPGDS